MPFCPLGKERHWGRFGKPTVCYSPPWDLPGATLSWAAFHSSEDSVCFRGGGAARVVISYWKASLQPVAVKTAFSDTQNGQEASGRGQRLLNKELPLSS